MSYPANLQFSPYRVFNREEWARLRLDTPMTLKESELEQGLSKDRAEEIAARTVNKTCSEHGETRDAQKRGRHG